MLRNVWLWALIAAVLAVGMAALAMALQSKGGDRPHRRRFPQRPHRDTFRSSDTPMVESPKRAAVIVNPTKLTSPEDTRDFVRRSCADHGWAPPLWLETTVIDPGVNLARIALDAGVDVVCALGGDGTVRAVAEALAGTEMPMGILPGGTGNLLARNLDIDTTDLGAALTVALTGHNKPVDVGRVGIDRDGDGEIDEERTFLVIAGMGFDAQIMADTPEALKARMGWSAYFFSGARNLTGERFRVTIQPDAEEAIATRARTVVIGNCGRLTGGITLMPDARIDDGILDLVVVSPKSILGWASVAGQVLRKKVTGNPRLDHHASSSFTVRADRPIPIQMDGDIFGAARELRVRVDPGALVVRIGDVEAAPRPRPAILVSTDPTDTDDQASRT